jgi:uncharacterized protein
MLFKLVTATGCELSIMVESPLRQRVREQRDAIVVTAARRGVRNVRLFGSVARGDESQTSDVDFLVDLDDDVTLLDLIGLERELALLLGCDVDVVPARNMKPEIAQRALAEATPL